MYHVHVRNTAKMISWQLGFLCVIDYAAYKFKGFAMALFRDEMHQQNYNCELGSYTSIR